MRTARYPPEQITLALRQAEKSTPVERICHMIGVSEPTFYRWKTRGSLGVSEVATSGSSAKTPASSGDS